MAVITISRELATLGEEVAQELGKITGWKVIDREYIEKRLDDFGFKREEQQRYDEKKPGFWAALSQNRIDYLYFLRRALFEEASSGNCIIVGRGASVIFKGISHHLAIRVTAPLAVRLERAMELCACDEKHAHHIIQQSDHDRTGFHKVLFEVDWYDPREYDLTINTARINANQSAQIIDECRTRVIKADHESEGKSQVSDLLLGQKVLTEIICVKHVHISSLGVSAKNGNVQLDGLSNTQSAIDAAIAAARAVDGVHEVKSAIHLMGEFLVNP